MLNLSDTKDLLLIASLLLAAASLVSLISIRTRMSSLMKFRDLMAKTVTDGAPETLLDVITALSAKTDGIAERTSELEHRAAQLADNAKACVQKIAVVRYNAFENMGADLSFSAAILDANLNGFVLTALYGREESRVYCKPVQHGETTYTLTDEEREALRKAGRNSPETT